MALRYDPVTRTMVDDDVPQLPTGLLPNTRTQAPAITPVPIAGQADALRTQLVSLLGGDTTAPSFDPQRASRALVDTASDAGNMLSRFGGAMYAEAQPTLRAAQGGLLSVLGAQPAPPAKPTVPQTQTPAPVAAQSEAQDPYSPEVLGAWAGPERTAAPATAEAPTANPQYGDYNTALGSTMQPQQRGLYTMQNTDQAALAQRAAPTNGITFGFGGGNETAQEYLTRMNNEEGLQNARNLAILTERRRVRDRHAVESRMAAAVESRDPIAIRAARAELAGFDAGNPALGASLLSAEAGLAQQVIQSEAARANAQLGLLGTQATAQATQAAASANRAGDLQKVQLQGQINAQLELLKAQAKSLTPEGQVAALRVQQIEAALKANDIESATALLGGGRPAAPLYDPLIDPVTGKPRGTINRRSGSFSLLPQGEQ